MLNRMYMQHSAALGFVVTMLQVRTDCALAGDDNKRALLYAAKDAHYKPQLIHSDEKHDMHMSWDTRSTSRTRGYDGHRTESPQGTDC